MILCLARGSVRRSFQALDEGGVLSSIHNIERENQSLGGESDAGVPPGRTREQNLFLAKVSQGASRFDDMADYMTRVAEASDTLSLEERGLINIAFKNALDSRRRSWQSIRDVEDTEAANGNTQRMVLAGRLRAKIEVELSEICYKILHLLDSKLIPASAGESRVFYLKL